MTRQVGPDSVFNQDEAVGNLEPSLCVIVQPCQHVVFLNLIVAVVA